MRSQSGGLEWHFLLDAPADGRGIFVFHTGPRRIADDEVRLHGQFRFRKKSAQRIVPRVFRWWFSWGIDQTRQYVALASEFLDIRQMKLIEESQVKAKSGSATGCFVAVHAKDVLTKDFQQSLDLQGMA